jgi:hypothetical protein
MIHVDLLSDSLLKNSLFVSRATFPLKLTTTVLCVQVKKKEEAKADYDTAVRSGVSAFLLEEAGDRPDVFQISVGRLRPGSVATILITYITEVQSWINHRLKDLFFARENY